MRQFLGAPLLPILKLRVAQFAAVMRQQKDADRRPQLFHIKNFAGFLHFRGEDRARHIFLHYPFAAPNRAESAENKKRTN